jgi:hypothetical protein
MVHLVPVAALCRNPQNPRLFSSEFRIVANSCSRLICKSSCCNICSTPMTMYSEPFSLGETLIGESGRGYTIQKVLAERRKPMLCVYQARYGPTQFGMVMIVNNKQLRT